jgi:hypothetical protein
MKINEIISICTKIPWNAHHTSEYAQNACLSMPRRVPLYASVLEYNNDHYYYLRQEVMFLSAFVHSLSRYDGLEARQTSKPQNRRPLFDVELYLTVHKSFVSTSLNIIYPTSFPDLSWLHVSSQLSLLNDYVIIRKYHELNHRDRAQININSDKNIIQWLLFIFQIIISW